MNVPTIEMTPEQAQVKLDAWLQENHSDQRLVREQCILGYQALAEGKKLIHLDGAIRAGGYHTSGYPKLAVARAYRERVRFRWRNTEQLASYDSRESTWSSPRRGNPGTLIRRVYMQREPNVQRGGGYVSLDGWAQVPLLPAEHRPLRGQLRDWFILWEVEQWFARDSQVEPDKDPMLLEHVAGQLYAVVAEWQLTELERAVMAGALRAQV